MVTFFFKNDRFRLVGRVHFLDIILNDHGAFIKHGPFPASFYVRPFHTQINILIGNSVDVVLGFEPRTTVWQAQTGPLSGRPITRLLCWPVVVTLLCIIRSYVIRVRKAPKIPDLKKSRTNFKPIITNQSASSQLSTPTLSQKMCLTLCPGPDPVKISA